MKKPARLSNNGAALPAVLMVMLVVMTLAAVVLTLTSQQAKEEAYYEKDTNALNIAEAGVHKYLWHLNKEASVLPMGTVINYPEDNPVGAFKLTSIEDASGRKIIQSTGWMLSDPTVTQIIKATFKKKSFAEYIYLSNSDADNIWWSTGDVCYGKYHTNGTLRVQGTPVFWDKVTYGSIVLTGSPTFKKGHSAVSAITLPSDNNELKGYADADGYCYKGRTSIRLNADGTITIWNASTTQTRPLPANGVIYVDDNTGFNYSQKFNKNNGNVFVSGKLNGRLTIGAKNDIYITGYDPTSEVFSSAALTGGVTYKDTTFSLDPLTGEVTAGGSAADGDLLGLVANRYVGVLTQGWFDDGTRNSSVKNFTVCGAIMALHGSFINSMFIKNSPSDTLPNPAYPSSGTLTVWGAIIQQTRGQVGWVGGSGYTKKYAHDPRMDYDTPPHLLEPTDSGWEITEWK